MERLFHILTIFLMLTSCNLSRTNFVIGNESMLPSLKKGDHAKINKTIDSLTYGDLIVFYYPGDEGYLENFAGYMISRVVGLPGDSIVVKKDICIINGKPNKFQFIRNIEKHQDEYNEHFPNGFIVHIFTPLQHSGEVFNASTEPILIPQNHYYVLGDNRGFATDSRYIGCIPKEKIDGKVIEINKKPIIRNVQSNTN